ncbi:MAG: HAMP domain-containing protein, partial [Nitrospirae bacterium]
LVMITLVNIKRILKAIRELNENAGAISKGDLRGTLTVRGDDEIAEMSVIFGGMADSLRHMVKKLITISSEIAVTNSKIWSALSSNIQNIERQTDEASQISTATTELSQTASEIAQNTSHAAEISKAVTGEAKKGMEKMKSADRMINDVASAAGVLNAMISELNSGIGSIGQVVELITDIADQTNLLALNAAIEAARAGEHGRGFAVVADEVRKLAEKTMKATSDIADTIRSIQEKSSDTSHQMGVATGKITESVGIINETAELLEKIVSYATLSEEETEKIATAVEEQSNTIEEISQSIGHSAGISREILETFRGFFEKTDRLSQAVELLEEEVRRFKLPPDRTLEIEAARVAHKNWVQRLYRMYYMEEHISVDEIKDHRECSFGKWYYSTDGQECSGLKGFHQIENPHRLLHERAKDAVEAFEKGERRRCLELIEEVDRISEEIILYLDGMLSDI